MLAEESGRTAPVPGLLPAARPSLSFSPAALPSPVLALEADIEAHFPKEGACPLQQHQPGCDEYPAVREPCKLRDSEVRKFT